MNARKVFTVARKAGVALIGALGAAVASNVLPDPWDKVGAAVVAVATWAGVYVARNTPAE